MGRAAFLFLAGLSGLSVAKEVGSANPRVGTTLTGADFAMEDRIAEYLKKKKGKGSGGDSTRVPTHAPSHYPVRHCCCASRDSHPLFLAVNTVLPPPPKTIRTPDACADGGAHARPDAHADAGADAHPDARPDARAEPSTVALAYACADATAYDDPGPNLVAPVTGSYGHNTAAFPSAVHASDQCSKQVALRGSDRSANVGPNDPSHDVPVVGTIQPSDD